MKLSSLLYCKSLLLASIIVMLLVSATMVTMVTMVNVASASPDTVIYVDPPEVRDVQPGGNFTITINVTEAPPSYAWEIYLSWDRTLLNVSDIKEGDFLHRWTWIPVPPPGSWVPQYDTAFAYTPLDEANVEGEMLVFCTLIGNLTENLWASGNGWLCTLNFTVKDEGSTLLNLFDTSLWDHMEEGYPAPTPYPNEYGFFSNVGGFPHDIAVTNVTASPTEVIKPNPVSINVTVTNEGAFSETFNVTTYYDVNIEIDTQTGITLAAGENITLTFTWYTETVDGGIYTISAEAVVAVDDDPGDNTLDDGTVTLLSPPVADFTYTSLIVNTQVNFTSTSYDPDGSITTWEWDLNGNGTIDAYTENATYTYTAEGDYNVTLTVTDNDGLNSTKTVTITVFPEKIHNVAITTVTPSATEAVLGEEVTITVIAKNKGSETETFNVTAYYDNTAIGTQNVTNLSSALNTTLAFTWDTTGIAYGNYTISANASLVEGETETEDNTYIYGNVTLLSPPVAKFTENATTVFTDVVIHFNASGSYDLDGSIMSYFWDFGDGVTEIYVEDVNLTAIATHAYADNGTYTVTLTVTDDDDLTNSTSAVKTVLNRPPVASFTESAETVLTAVVIHFNASESQDPDGYIVSYFWDFGDGTNATGVTVDHAYTDDGTYIVTLTVTDDDGATATATSTKSISNRPPVAIFTESAETVLTDEMISFNAGDSYDPDGTIASYFWDFGDETNATEVTVNHAYEDDGVYTVTLTVTDDDGAITSTSAVKTVSNRPPVASFTEDATTVDTGEVIHFNASESYDPDGSIVSYFWDFGDGTNATGVTVDHAYTDDGTYIVTLTVTDDDDASSSESATKTVKAPEGWPLTWLVAIGLGFAALALIALYALYRRRKE